MAPSAKMARKLASQIGRAEAGFRRMRSLRGSKSDLESKPGNPTRLGKWADAEKLRKGLGVIVSTVGCKRLLAKRRKLAKTTRS